MKHFDSKAKLATDIGITRATLYRRADRLGINIDDLAGAGLSDEDYQKLTIDQSSGAVSGNAQQLKELASVQAELERLKEENTRIAEEADLLKSERSTIQDANEALKEQVEKLSQDHDALNEKYISALEDVRIYANKFAQLADQSQRLQAQTTKHIEESVSQGERTGDTTAKEPEIKGFWARLFKE